MTASADRGEHYRSGKTRHVRFTLDVELFFHWSEAPIRFPQWTARYVDLLHAAARGKSNPGSWWCRASPIPLNDIAAIETRSYRDPRWVPLGPTIEVAPMTRVGRDLWLGVNIAGTTFASRKGKGPQGQDAFEVRTARDRSQGEAA